MHMSSFRLISLCRKAVWLCALLSLFYLLAIWTFRAKEGYGSEFVSPRCNHKKSKGRGNFEPKDSPKHFGPGENGEKHLLRKSKSDLGIASVLEYGMDIVCSDEISMHRSLPDTRLEECKYWDYPSDLPKTSVIIAFHNEGFSVLMRTVHSVIDRSPKLLLHEVILIDDCSDKIVLKEDLKDYIKQFNGLVKLLRNRVRQGLIRTRTRGANQATGDVIVFLDAHCEVNVNWLPPLLAPIYSNRTVMTVPIIDKIDYKTFEYRSVYPKEKHHRGIFEWGMLYKESDVPKRELRHRAHNSDPYRSPTHSGGLFAINRKYFLELGAYDPGLEFWGGENFELSFKIWQCGGSIEWVPCSRVGHVYRNSLPYNYGNFVKYMESLPIKSNYKRVIEIWFDDTYKEYFYTREPMARYFKIGNISEQLELKRRLNCKSFKWFMENVAYEVYEKFPPLPPNVHWGELRSVAIGECVDSFGFKPPTLMSMSLCHRDIDNQLIRLNAAGQLGVGERCIESDRKHIKMIACHLGSADGPWNYDESTNQLLHRIYKQCMAVHPISQQLFLGRCDVNDVYQKWTFEPMVTQFSEKPPKP